MTDTTLAIGDVARQTGVSVSAIRYYDDVDLIQPAGRVGGKRRFGHATVGRVNFIRRAQDAGFSLDEIRLILNDRARAWPSLVDAKLAELSERRDRLDSMIEILHEVRACGCEVVESCSALPGGS